MYRHKVKRIIEELENLLAENEHGLEISDRRVIIETDRLKEGFDDFDWSNIELPPEALPSWIKHELDTHIPDGTVDGDIISRRFDDYIFVIKYRNIKERDYIVIEIEKIKKELV